MKKIWLKKSSSFKEASDFDDKYYSSMSGEERISIIQSLREQYWKIKDKDKNNGNTKRLRGSIKIIKQT